MLGIEDKWILAAYLLCIGSALLCAAYGIINWNRGEETVRQEDVHWAAEEKKAEAEA